MTNLISDEYKEQLKYYHEFRPNFGKGAAKEYDAVLNLADGISAKTILDYGCGKGIMVEKIKNTRPDITIHGYDPAIAEFSNIPLKKYDIVTCFDVVEHIEPDSIYPVLTHIHELTAKTAFIIAACYPAKKSLPDGRNAHLIVEPPEWWREHFKKIGWEFKNEKIKTAYKERLNLEIIEYEVILHRKINT